MIFDLVVNILVGVGLGVMFVVWIGIIVRYKQNTFRVVGIAGSYLLLATLAASAQLFHVFGEGVTREVAQMVAVLAFVLGDIALYVVWRDGGSQQQAIREFKARLDRHKERLDALEAMLAAIDNPKG